MPAGDACAAASVEPQVNFTYFQSLDPVLMLVITPTCTYTFPEKFKSAWFPFVASTVIVILSLSFANCGVHVSNCAVRFTSGKKNKINITGFLNIAIIE